LRTTKAVQVLKRHRSAIVAIAIYAALTVVAFWDAWTLGLSDHAIAGGGDPAASMWFLTWAPYALLHAHNPLLSDYGNYPYGINMLMNTSTLTLGVLAAPITLLFGPVASFNLVETAGMLLSASAAYALACRFTQWRPAAFAAGLLYGFSPYMVAAGLGHLMTLCVFIPPLALLLVHDITVRQPDHHPVVRGAILGVLLVGQFFISTEVFAGLVIFMCAVIVLVAVMGPRELSSRLRYATVAFATTAVVGIVLLAYPIWLIFDGPGHVVGPLQADPQRYSADLLGPLVPGRLQRLSTSSSVHLSAGFGGNVTENGSYLGLPLVAVLVAGVIALWRTAWVRIAAVLCASAFVLSLGARLRVDNHKVAIPLPETVLGKLPLLSSALPVRFSLYVVLFASLILAAVLERVHQLVRGRLLSVVLPALLGAAVFVPLIPTWPYPVVATPVPQYFTSAVDAIPPNSVVLLYPFPDQVNSVPERWQASTYLRFKIVGGRFNVAQPGTDALVSSLRSETDVVLSALLSGSPLPRSTALKDQVEGELRKWSVHYVVAIPSTTNRSVAIPYLSWLLGRPPAHVAGAFVWYDWQ